MQYSLGSPLREGNIKDKPGAKRAFQTAFVPGGFSHLLRGTAVKAPVPEKQWQSSWGGAAVPGELVRGSDAQQGGRRAEAVGGKELSGLS